MGAYFLKKQARSPILEGFGRNIYALLSFSGQQYFNIEASLGIGYVHTRYDKYKCTTCGKKEGKGDADYIGPTRAAISIIYMLK